MNRQMRRLSLKISSTKPPRTTRFTNRPMLHEVHMAFGPVESFLDQLESGYVDCEDTTGAPVIRAFDGDVYVAVPAMRVLISSLQRITNHYRMDVDFGPAIKLCNKLEANMPLTLINVQQAQSVIQLCKAAYRKMDAYVVKDLVNTELIQLELEKKGLTA